MYAGIVLSVYKQKKQQIVLLLKKQQHTCSSNFPGSKWKHFGNMRNHKIETPPDFNKEVSFLENQKISC